ncbi:MAG TPA: pyridoxal phosphate-dependent aminotransferase [Synergistaceae bacterium]|nr:pyridoxal phosphate-dependent aminotransferase [Synergistaceae bacterium]
MRLSSRILRMQPSATALMAAKAREKKRLGFDVISFATGEPDYDSPSEAITAAQKAMAEGQTHYPPTNGIMPLRSAVAEYYNERFNLQYDPAKEIIVGTGAKQLIYEALGALINPGDEVIVFSPAWVSYVEQIRLFDGIPIKVDTSESDFIPDFRKIEKITTQKTVAMIVNSPNNPTGVVYSTECLERLAHLALKNDLIIINDEVYERLVFDQDQPPQIVKICPKVKDSVLNINGVSKAFAMTGWRIGYALGPAKLIKAISDFQGHLTSGTSSISQWASVGALQKSQKKCEEMRAGFHKRRDLIVKLLSEIDGISIVVPQGAFYVFINISSFLGENARPRFKDDVSFCEEFLEKKNVSLVPGTAFLSPGFVRISYSCSEEEICEGVRRFGEFLEEICVE